MPRANTVTLANVETLSGGTGSDVVTLGAAVTAATIDLGSGADSLTLFNAAANTVTVAQYRDADRRHR